MEDLQHSMAALASATESFSQNWLLSIAPFEFSYIRSDSEGAECDDQGSVGSFNFGAQLPHWFKVGDEDGVVYADELFFEGFIKAGEFDRVAPDVSGREREALCVGKDEESSVSSPAAVLRCRFLGKWGKETERVVMRWWRVFKEVVENNVGGRTRNGMKKNKGGSFSDCPLGRSGPGTAENPIYEAILHCKRSIGE